MRKVGVAAVLAFLSLASASSAFAQLVTRVVDGDTIHVEGIGSVRLIGVDTPESVDPRKPVEFFAKEAGAFTRQIALAKVVRLEFDIQRKDKYDRTLAYVYLPDGTFLNAEIVKQGYGHAYTQYPFKYLDQFRGYEDEARELGRGLWGTQGSTGAVSLPAPGQTVDALRAPPQPASASSGRCQATTKRGTLNQAGVTAGSTDGFAVREAGEIQPECLRLREVRK